MDNQDSSSQNRIQVRFSVPESDIHVLSWLSSQDNVPYSLRQLIRDRTATHGYDDVFLGTSITPPPPKGRVPGYKKNGLARQLRNELESEKLAQISLPDPPVSDTIDDSSDVLKPQSSEPPSQASGSPVLDSLL